MNDFKLSYFNFVNNQEITIAGSKSETNRMLLLKALYPEIDIHNASTSDDSKVMEIAIKSKDSVVDVHHAGTAMRFLTAYFANNEHADVVIKGSDRMHERPINILVTALRKLGAKISYLETDGYPPIHIQGCNLKSELIEIDANVSSQYISALLLIAPKISNGLKLKLIGEQTSVPYINMTLSLLNQIGVETYFSNDLISVESKNSVEKTTVDIESDWSSASYYYQLISFLPIGSSITLSNFKKESLQADRVVVDIYKNFGVETTFLPSNKILITKAHQHQLTKFDINLVNAPDIAQTIAVTCLGLQIPCNLSGLHTLKIKETNRLLALKNEIEKFGIAVTITEDTLSISDKAVFNDKLVEIDTYQDHRMAMAFTPLVIKQKLIIKNANVVSKSYIDFWDHFKKIGLNIND